MEELHFTGNCLKGSRPILSFGAEFETKEHWKVVKEVLTQSFGVPRSARKVKPFVDHVMGFTIADGKIWIRCYEVKESEASSSSTSSSNAQTLPIPTVKTSPHDTQISLVEIGPRFVLTPIVILESSFGGPVIYENKEFVSPNQVRSDLRKAKAGRVARRSEKTSDAKVKRGELGLASEGGKKKVRGPLDERDLFA